MAKKTLLKKFFGQKNFVKKIFGQKNFQRKKNWSNKIILVKRKFGPKCFRFLSKKLGRVNPGVGIYDPPPENSRVKIVWNCC